MLSHPLSSSYPSYLNCRTLSLSGSAHDVLGWSSEQGLHCVPFQWQRLCHFHFSVSRSHYTTCPLEVVPASHSALSPAHSLKCPKRPGPTDQRSSQNEGYFPPWMQETWRNHTAGLRKAKTEPDYLVPDYHRLSTVFLARMLSKMLDILPRCHPAQEGEKKRKVKEFSEFCMNL